MADHNPPTQHLRVELVPLSTWGWNLRSELASTTWDKLRRKIYQQAGHVCEICGGKGKKHPVECHEKWEYNDATHIQKLVGLEALCPTCHGVKHIGRTMTLGEAPMLRAVGHLAKVNGWTMEEAWEHVNKAFLQWQERSKHEWLLDLTWLQHGL